MENEDFKNQHQLNRFRVRKMLRIDATEDLTKPNVKREQFVALLKKSHGYTDKKASTEFERLLKQFYRMDRTSGVSNGRLNSINP